MKVVKTLSPIDTGAKKAIFLAGPTYRIKSNTTITSEGFDVPKSWREDALQYLSIKGFDGIVYLPEWENNTKPNGWTYTKQVEWEVAAMNASDYTLFWIPREMKDLPGLTTNIEFGEWLHSNRIVVGAPDTAEKMEYIKSRCAMEGIPFHSNLQECVQDICDKITEKTISTNSLWFTADTHFSQLRTLQLSKRPFKSIEEMDRDMIRNWNFKVREDDTVCHLGDYGAVETAFEILKQLNFKKLLLVPGNYDTPELCEVLKADPRVEILSQGDTLNVSGVEMRLVHEPEHIEGNLFHLYGHVHQLQMVKTNAFNVGTDCHEYAPINTDTVMFYHNAITKHYDKNVFNDFQKE